jgi:hypothetical protein
MKNLIIVSLFAAFTLTACVVSPGPGEYGGVEVSPLPGVVVLGDDPYYYQDGYFYNYHNNNWSYSQSRNGPWADLPRSHWPNEVRHRYKDRDREGMASPLPPVVVLGDEPYFYQDGYYYYFNKDNWKYSQSRNGPWMGLPRAYWPKEVRFRYSDVMASPLPGVVVLGNDPYYYQDGYFYYYHKNKWRYSQSRNGPWADLPKSYWPKEVRHRDRDDDRGRGRDDKRDRDKGHDHDGR